jgi:hypothetical protein
VTTEGIKTTKECEACHFVFLGPYIDHMAEREHMHAGIHSRHCPSCGVIREVVLVRHTKTDEVSQ